VSIRLRVFSIWCKLAEVLAASLHGMETRKESDLILSSLWLVARSRDGLRTISVMINFDCVCCLPFMCFGTTLVHDQEECNQGQGKPET